MVLRPRDLDARLVPRLAAGLRTALDGSARRGRTAYAAASRRGTSLLAGGSALRRLDDRYAASGPLAVVREVPQVGVLVVALVFLAGTGAAVALNDPPASVGTTADGGPGPGGGRSGQRVLGPVVGADIDAHFAATAAVLRELAERDPGAERLALVSLREGLPPDGALELLDRTGVELQRAYLRAAVPGVPEEIAFSTSGDLRGDLRRVYEATAERKGSEAAALRETAATIDSASPAEAEFKAQFEADAATADAEAAAYASSCACVFSLVVRAETEVLAALLAEPLVRGVEVAPPGTEVTSLDLRPLAPSQRGSVTDPAPAVA